MSPLKIAVIVGSVRENRFADKPARWIAEQAKKLGDVEVETLDLKDHPLPFYDRAVTPSMSKPGEYGEDAADAWAKKIAAADAFVIVTPEYNHGPSAVIKNALDAVFHEWARKPVGFVSYGSVGGARAVEQLRLNAVELSMAPIRTAVHIPGNVMFPILFGKAEWNAETEAGLRDDADKMLTQLLWWAKALKAARERG